MSRSRHGTYAIKKGTLYVFDNFPKVIDKNLVVNTQEVKNKLTYTYELQIHVYILVLSG